MEFAKFFGGLLVAGAIATAAVLFFTALLGLPVMWGFSEHGGNWLSP